MTDAPTQYTLHASGLTRWTDCPAREIDRIINADKWVEDNEGLPVRARFGTIVHALVADTEIPPEARPIVYDEITPNAKELDFQAKTCANALKQHLQQYDVMEKDYRINMKITFNNGQYIINLTGELDLILRHKETGKYAIADIKTGKRNNHANWIQIAAYCWLVERSEYKHEIDHAIKIWTPRNKITMGKTFVEEQVKSAKDLTPILMKQINMIHKGFTSEFTSPGRHCDTCKKEDCVFYPPTA